jgi:hypothetical protein
MNKGRNKPKSTEINVMIWANDTAVPVIDICADYRLRCKLRNQDGVNILQAEP